MDHRFRFGRPSVVPVALLRCAGFRISPQRPTHSKLRLERSPARPVKASPFCVRARLPSRGTFHRLTSCDACRVRSETRFLRTSLLGSGGFAATGPRAALLHRDDAALLLQARWSRLGPRSRPRSYRCERFSGPDAASRLLQRVFNLRHTSTNPASAVLARCRGLPCSRCRARCVLHAARVFLFECEEDSSSMRRSELRVFPRRSASRAKP